MALYREVVERIRASDVDVIINTTAGMGGDLVLDPHDPTTFVEGTDLVSGVDRLPHVEELLPDICTLDCGSLNFGEGSLVYVSTPDMLREGAKKIQELGVRGGDGDLRHRSPLVRQPAGRGGADRRAGDVPALHGHPVRRSGRPDDAGRHGRPDPGGRRLGLVRARPDADAVGGAVGAARGARPGRPRGQPLPQQGREGDERPAGRAGKDHRGEHGREGGHARRGARDPRAEADDEPGPPRRRSARSPASAPA